MHVNHVAEGDASYSRYSSFHARAGARAWRRAWARSLFLKVFLRERGVGPKIDEPYTLIINKIQILSNVFSQTVPPSSGTKATGPRGSRSTRCS